MNDLITSILVKFSMNFLIGWELVVSIDFHSRRIRCGAIRLKTVEKFSSLCDLLCENRLFFNEMK